MKRENMSTRSRGQRDRLAAIERVSRQMVIAGFTVLERDKKLYAQVRGAGIGELVLQLKDSPLDAAAAFITLLEGIK